MGDRVLAVGLDVAVGVGRLVLVGSTVVVRVAAVVAVALGVAAMALAVAVGRGRVALGDGVGLGLEPVEETRVGDAPVLVASGGAWVARVGVGREGVSVAASISDAAGVIWAITVASSVGSAHQPARQP